MKYLFKILVLSILFFAFTGCTFNEGIIPGKDLSDKDRIYIEELGLIDPDESIILFTSVGMKHNENGNFFTNKRVAQYWTYRDQRKISSTLYTDIQDLSINYDRGSTYATEITISKQDGTKAYIYIDDSKEKEEDFFQQLNKNWQATNTNLK